MGLYINPENVTKEQFLNTNGVALPNTPKWEDIGSNHFAVCLVNNGPFTAAGVCFSPDELVAFNQPTDFRPKKWYIVTKRVVLDSLRSESDIELCKRFI